MKPKLIIIPNKSVGNIELNMSVNTIESTLYSNHILNINSKEEKICNNIKTAKYYSDSTLLFIISYVSGSSFEICIDENISEFYDVVLDNTNMFKEKFSDIIYNLEKKSTYTCDTDDFEFGTEFDFTDLGITLWRERAFNDTILKSKFFNNLSSENQLNEEKYWYFQMINIHN